MSLYHYLISNLHWIPWLNLANITFHAFLITFNFREYRKDLKAIKEMEQIIAEFEMVPGDD